MEIRGNRWKWKAFWVFVIAVLFFVGIRIYYRATDDFRIANITYDQLNNLAWNIAPLTSNEKKNLDKILNQKFYYIDKGAQSYAFKSQDGLYVLKFFKFKHLRPHWFLQMLPSVGAIKKYQDNQLKRKEKNLKGVFAGYKLAYELDREDSGLYFIHLNKTTDLQKSVILVNKIGFEQTIDLDPIVFIVQKRVEQFKIVMDHLLNKGDVETAKKRIAQVLELYFSEYKKGLYDKDHGVMHNIGFIGEKPIHFDVGKMSQFDNNNPEFYKNDLKMVIYRMKGWIKNNHPDKYSELSIFIEKESSELNEKLENAIEMDK
jgi:hypothetical protein